MFLTAATLEPVIPATFLLHDGLVTKLRYPKTPLITFVSIPLVSNCACATVVSSDSNNIIFFIRSFSLFQSMKDLFHQSLHT